MDARVQDMVVRLPVDAICASACQPRTRFAEQSLEELSESIRQHGLLSPVVVRRMGDGYELIAGERRLRAVRRLGQPVIDALVRTVDAREAALLALIENLQREDLHYLEQAQAFRQLLLSYGFSQEVLAARLGISQGAVANKLRLLKLPEQVRARLVEHGLSERHARALLSLGCEQAQLEAAERAAAERMSVRQLEELARKMATAKPRPHYRLYLRDHRVLINAVLDVVKSLNQAGVKASSRVERMADRIEVTVVIPSYPAAAESEGGGKRGSRIAELPAGNSRRGSVGGTDLTSSR